ncbi:hypothetical protein [Marinobacter halophilus]|uniref:Uncharacterized protein n=1 Tax=Marinobacter halophilus TaxID=1323740 RepID=A0A2T1K7V4_9GAMM|nr:hypothetical protein [Marinobacter halophilus]PSF06236.1 hypothetical protein C7H08_13980 [Marinobacter halophilus]
MSLIYKPFDDSGVDMVDDIARYGTSISKRIEQFRQRGRLQGAASEPYSGFAVALALCDTLSEIIDSSSHEPYRVECARAVDTLCFESMTSGHLSGCEEPPKNHRHSQELIQAISAILADDQILPADGSIPLQTVLLALVWSALTFALESLPPDQARLQVQKRIRNSKSALSVH